MYISDTSLDILVHEYIHTHRSPKQGNRKRQRLLEMISNGLSEAHEKEMEHLTPGSGLYLRIICIVL